MHLTIFRSRKRADMNAAAYAADAQQMEQAAVGMPGFIAVKTFHADDGETVTISEWDSLDAARGWGRDSGHAEVQQRGKNEYYEEYTLYSCTDPLIRRFRRSK